VTWFNGQATERWKSARGMAKLAEERPWWWLLCWAIRWALTSCLHHVNQFGRHPTPERSAHDYKHVGFGPPRVFAKILACWVVRKMRLLSKPMKFMPYPALIWK